MRAGVIGIPESGSIEERRYEAVGDCTWVRFEPDVGEPWAGVFGGGSGGNVVPFSESSLVLVISGGGRGYVVCGDTGELLHTILDGDMVEGITVPGRPFVVVTTSLFKGIMAVSQEGVVWEEQMVADDEVRLGSANEHEVRGRLRNYDGWYRFVLKLSTWEFTYEPEVAE